MKPRPSHRTGLTTVVLGAVLFLGAILAPRLAHAVGEVNGRIKGNVVEAQTQAPVPGAQVKITGKALIGNARLVTTGDDGSFQVFELAPGTYTVEVSYQGVKPIKKTVVIRQGETFPLDIQWSAELAEQEVTVVEEQRRMTRPDQTSTGTVLTGDQMKRVATDRSYQDVIQQIASVTDVSGNGNPEIKGANYTQTRYLIDGLDITDPVTGTFSANINFDTISSIQVLTGAMEAQYNSLGGVINLITDGGSDDWKVNASFYINNAKLSAGNQYGSRVFNGIKTFDPTPKPVTQSYQANLSVGGPIMKHRLWFNVSLQYDYTERSNVAAPPLNVTSPPRRFQGVNARLKLTWAPTDKHRIQLSLSGDPAFIDNTNQDPGGLPITENAQIQGGAFVTLLWNYFISDKTQFDIQTGFQYNRLYDGPMGILRSVNNVSNPYSARANTYDPNAAQHFNNDDQSTWYQGPGVSDDRRYTFQFDPSISLRGKAAGTHDAKIGLQSRYTRWNYDAYTPGGSTYTDQGGGPLESGICQVDASNNPVNGNGCFQRTDSAPSNVYAWNYSLGFFIQDRWQPLKRLYIFPGMRVDWGISKNNLGQTVSNLVGFGPRLGFAVDLTGDQKTMFKVDYGRSNEVNTLLAGAYATPTGNFTVNQYDPASNSFQKLFSGGGAGGFRTDPYGNTPHVDSVTVSLNREVFKDSLVQIDYTYKHFANMWDSVEINQIWDPSGTRVVGYKNNQAEQIVRYSRPGDNYRDYQGIDFSLESRPNEHWDLYASYSLQWLYGPGIESFGQIQPAANQSQFYNPRMRNTFDGFDPNDVRHTVKLRGSYNWKGLNIGAILQWHTGTPLTHRYWNAYDGGYNNRRSPTGTDPGATPNDTTQISEFRLPDTMLVNMRISYDLHRLIKQHLMVIADMFNLFNLGAATAIRSSDSALFGLVTARQSPFQLQLGLRYDF
jgi:hypothetical protein